MTRSSNKMATVLNLILVLSLLLMISISESSTQLGVGVEAIDAECNTVYGAEVGDSCDTVTEKFGLSLEEFLAINVSCNFFEGQWLCVDGSPN
ncbi:hypothetical protein ABKV19_012457 [Rosa sericea]